MLPKALGLGIAALILGSAAMLGLRAESWALRPADWAAVRFTLLQAALSAVLSLGLAVPLARALFRELILSTSESRNAKHIPRKLLGRPLTPQKAV